MQFFIFKLSQYLQYYGFGSCASKNSGLKYSLFLRLTSATSFDLAVFHTEARAWPLEDKDIRRHFHKMSDRRSCLVDGFGVWAVQFRKYYVNEN